MTYIVGQGSCEDPRSLDLQTQRKWRIPNELRPELPLAARMEAIKIVTEEYPSARALVVYRDTKCELSHVAMVHSVTPVPAASSHTVTVVSAWGQSGEYCHEMGNVSPLLGTPRQIWSKRLIP